MITACVNIRFCKRKNKTKKSQDYWQKPNLSAKEAPTTFEENSDNLISCSYYFNVTCSDSLTESQPHPQPEGRDREIYPYPQNSLPVNKVSQGAPAQHITHAR